MITYWARLIPAAFLILTLTSCGDASGGGAGGSSAAGYKETKSMVLDILKTEEAHKAFQEASQVHMAGQARLLSTGDGLQIQAAVKDVLTKTDQVKLIQQLAVDPKFAGDFAKSARTELKQIHKDLIKDPDYQKAMIDVMKNPEYQRMIADSLKATEYRQQVMTVIQDALHSPLYKAELINLMKRALEENAIQSRSTRQGGTQGKGQGGGQGGGGGGGQSGGTQDGQEGGSSESGSEGGSSKKSEQSDSEQQGQQEGGDKKREDE